MPFTSIARFEGELIRERVGSRLSNGW